jgi:hypothetical protein
VFYVALAMKFHYTLGNLIMSVVREQTVPSILKAVHLSNTSSLKFMSDKTESENFDKQEKVTMLKVPV